MDVIETPPPPYDARIPYGEAPPQFGDLRVPPGDGPHPIVVILHGGFWRARYDLEHLGHLCAAFTREGYATWNLEYRKVGERGGGFPGTFADVLAGIEALRPLSTQYPIDVSRTVVVGFSAGGQLALFSAAQREQPRGVKAPPPTFPLRGAVSLAGVVDLCTGFSSDVGAGAVRALMGDGPEALPQAYAAACPTLLAPIHTPVRLVHGSADDQVPPQMSEVYARHTGAPLQRLDGAGHLDLIDPESSAWPHVLRAVQALLG